MTGLVFLIPIALLMGLTSLVAFFWAVRTGQFDDPDGSAVRILISPDEPLAETPAGLGPTDRPVS